MTKAALEDIDPHKRLSDVIMTTHHNDGFTVYTTLELSNLLMLELKYFLYIR